MAGLFIAGGLAGGWAGLRAAGLLADRALKAGAAVISPNGKPFTDASIGNAVAVRAIHSDLRAGLGDGIARGPAPFSKSDRSRFLSALDAALVALKKTRS